MNADHAVQLRLLDLQAADTLLAQLAHRRKTLPALAALADCETRINQLEDDAVDQEMAIEDLANEQRKLEADVDNVRARTLRDKQRLDGGGLPPQDLVNLQHEIETLARRQSNLEDDLLDVMERREAADTEVAAVRAQQAEVRAEKAEHLAARDAAFAEIDAAATERTAARTAIAAELPADLIALYNRVREHSGGIGAAMLRARRCEGCRIELPGSDITAIRAAAPDKVVRCENCGRILVRTAESGL